MIELKKVTRKIGPITNAVVNFHNMVKEFMLIPRHIKTQERDWNILTSSFPGLADFENKRYDILKEFKTVHRDYIANYSAPLISLSLQRSAFFYFFCSVMQPKSILDLGSGFSSYVFRKYAQNHNNAKVVSVDDSTFWLTETRDFLSKYNVSTNDVVSWKEFENYPEKIYDLTFLDISDFPFRLRVLPELIEKVKQGGFLIVDDFHVPFYRKGIQKLCAEREVVLLSLRKVTRTRLSHCAVIHAKISKKNAQTHNGKDIFSYLNQTCLFF